MITVKMHTYTLLHHTFGLSERKTAIQCAIEISKPSCLTKYSLEKICQEPLKYPLLHHLHLKYFILFSVSVNMF